MYRNGILFEESGAAAAEEEKAETHQGHRIEWGALRHRARPIWGRVESS